MPTTAIPTRLPGQVASPPGPVDLTSMYVVHHAFRRDLARFVARTEEAASPPGVRLLERRWLLFVQAIRHHHEGEDRGLWPALRARVSGEEAEVLHALEHEHEDLNTALDACSRAVHRVGRADWGGIREEAHHCFRAAANVVEAHLSHEEEAGMAIVQRHLRHTEWVDIERGHFQKGLGPRAVVAGIFWVLDGLPAPVCAAVLRDAPAPVRPIWLLTRRGFERRERALFGPFAGLAPAAG